jgi:hypothetical protein
LGNHSWVSAMARLSKDLSRIPVRKTTVPASGDIHKPGSDRVAGQVIKPPEPVIQRQPEHKAGEEESIPSFAVFVASERKRKDKKFAQRLGREDAARIRASGKLTKELRQELNAKLRFFEGDAWKIYGQEIKPALEQVIAGGVADVTNLEQDMRDVLSDWREAAIQGANLFATTALSNRIDALESGSWTGFITALIGNTIWAAAAFTPVGAAGKAFAVSMAGVIVASSPTVPSKSKSAIPQVQKLMGDYIYSVYDQLNVDLRNKAQLLIKEHPGITRYRALGKFVQNSFKPDFYKIAENDETVPTLEKSAIRDKYEKLAADSLDIYTSIGRVPPYEYHANEIAWVRLGEEKKLAMIEVDYFCASGNCPPHEFKKWIPKESESIAIERWKAFPWSQGRIRTFEAADISFNK